MDNNFSASPEKPERIKPSQEVKKSNEKDLDTGKVFEADLSGILETGAEAAGEVIDNMVSEGTGEDRKKASGGKIKSGTAATGNAKPVKAMVMPQSVDLMRTQISVKIKKEIVVLEKEAAKIMSMRQFNPFKLTKIVGRIRELKEILSSLTYATVESLKNWWLKFVKGTIG